MDRNTNGNTGNNSDRPSGTAAGRSHLIRRIALLGAAGLVLGCLVVFILVELWPAGGARVANLTRNLFGPQVVAQLETIVFQVQDRLETWQYQSGVRQAAAPWEQASPPAQIEASNLPPTTASPTLPTPTATPAQAAAAETLPATEPPQPTPSATPAVWQLADLAPFGDLEGEGVWQPYLYDQTGQVVARRTFLQPDPERPQALVAVVAFDLTRTDLHFVLGFNDPALPDGPRGDGRIPEEDLDPQILLAAFNGGFRAANGMFGAMADGVEALPPKDGLATVAIYQDGRVQIGAWREDIQPDPELVSWRQNAPLVVQDGAISERVYNDSIVDWGGTISNQIVTRRSGLSLDQAGETLFYFAGPSLSMPVLGEAMLAAGVYAGMLLDINHFWVHFTAIYAGEDRLRVEALLPEDMTDQVERYLGASPVDFFYVTLREEGELD